MAGAGALIVMAVIGGQTAANSATQYLQDHPINWTRDTLPSTRRPQDTGGQTAPNPPAPTPPASGYSRISQVQDADLPAIARFAEEAPGIQAARNMRSFGSSWNIWAKAYTKGEMEVGMNLYVSRVGDRVEGAMLLLNRGAAMEIRALEAVGDGAGTRLIQEAIRQSMAQGFGGRLQLTSADQAMMFYEKLGFVYRDGMYYLDEQAANHLLGR